MEKTENRAARRHDWQQSLAEIQTRPLKYCQSFPEIAQRWNDWWQFKADRPLILAQVATTSAIRWDKAFDLLEQPEAWLDVRRRQVAHTYYAGEALPYVRVDIGPVAMGAFLGAPLHIALKQHTTWQSPVIESWNQTPSFELDPDNVWWRRTELLIDQLAEAARDEHLVCLPDLAGAIDVLANMRTTQKLCFDLYEHREEVLSAAAEAVHAWETVFSRMYDIVLGHGAGITQWVACWADSPFTVPTCDFNALIGPEDFKEVCMPSLKDQARRAGLCVFHLDGPDAARHAEELGRDPDITAVQYTPGPGSFSAVAKLPMFHLLQQQNIPLFIECPFAEVHHLLQELNPAGVAVRVSGVKTPEQADKLVAWREQTFR